MIIDSQVHLGTSVFFHITSDVDLLLRPADEMGFGRLFITESNTLFYDRHERNDRLAREIARHPDRLIGYSSVSTPRLG